jgi:hypothetical protein
MRHEGRIEIARKSCTAANANETTKDPQVITNSADQRVCNINTGRINGVHIQAADIYGDIRL